MSVWRPSSVVARPSVTLRDWCVFEVPGTAKHEMRTTHFVGYSVEEREGRVSSCIILLDRAGGRGTTKSGRIYELQGPPGLDGDGAYTWGRWQSINRVSEVVDVTNEFAQRGPARSPSRNPRIE